MVAVRMGTGRAPRWSFGGRAWASNLAAGMVLAGAAVVLFAWTLDRPSDTTSSSTGVLDVDVDDATRILVTQDGRTIFGTPLRPVGPERDTPSVAVPRAGSAAPATRSGGRADTGGATGSGGGGSTRTPPRTPGTSTPTPTPTAPTPTPGGDGGSGAGGGTPVAPVAPPAVGPTSPEPGVQVTVTAGDATVTAQVTVDEAEPLETILDTATVTAGGTISIVPLLGTSTP